MAPRTPPKLTDRSSGVLLHLMSLPGPLPNGDLGEEARHFVDFLAGARQRWWQMLPVGPIGTGHSPYSSISSFAGEPLFINPKELLKSGLLRRRDLPEGSYFGHGSRIAYDRATKYREGLLRKAYQYAKSGGTFFASSAYRSFARKEAFWLKDYALFSALSSRLKTSDWSQWPEDLKRRAPEALARAERNLSEDVRYHKFLQFIFWCQWENLRKYAASRGVGLIGDIPIFVSYGSADVWAHPQYFLLRKDLSMQAVAGVPPDLFCKDGQLWGNALYNWPALKKSRFSWWTARFKRMLTLFDAIRLDHFIGFYRYWQVPAGAATAKEGRWVKAPGDGLFSQVKRVLGRPPFIAEDLGDVVQGVWDLRDKYQMPGMKVLQFGFDDTEGARIHRPHFFPRNCVVYTGTHDNNTSRGWYQEMTRSSRAEDRKRLAAVQAYLTTNGKEVHWDMIRAAMSSTANVAIFPAQDLLGLGVRDRMNIPGQVRGNWEWRLRQADLTQRLRTKLARLTEICDR